MGFCQPLEHSPLVNLSNLRSHQNEVILHRTSWNAMCHGPRREQQVCPRKCLNSYRVAPSPALSSFSSPGDFRHWEGNNQGYYAESSPLPGPATSPTGGALVPGSSKLRGSRPMSCDPEISHVLSSQRIMEDPLALVSSQQILHLLGPVGPYVIAASRGISAPLRLEEISDVEEMR